MIFKRLAYLILFFNLTVHAHDYVPFPQSNFTWIVEDAIWEIPMAHIYYCMDDTISIHDTLYTRIKTSRTNLDGEPLINDALFGYVRQDTAVKKVYLRMSANTPEFMIYDFDIHMGDTLYIPRDFEYPEGFHEQGIVIGKDSMLIFDEYRSQYLIAFGCTTLYWIEGFGTEAGPFISLNEYCIADQFYWLYSYTDTSICKIPVDIYERSINAQTVYPNPIEGGGSLNLSNENSKLIHVCIYTVTGFKLLDTRTTDGSIRLDPARFKAGMYIYQVSSRDHTISAGKLLIQ
jgi:hypothetical protein